MKTMCKLGEKVIRVSDKKAIELVKQGWAYCSKQLYKNQQKVEKFLAK